MGNGKGKERLMIVKMHLQTQKYAFDFEIIFARFLVLFLDFSKKLVET